MAFGYQILGFGSGGVALGPGYEIAQLIIAGGGGGSPGLNSEGGGGGGDTFSADARVLGVKIFYTTDAANDA